MEINRFKYLIAPIIGLLITFPIIAVILYFIFFQEDVSEISQVENIFNYTQTTLILLLGVSFFASILGIITSYLSARYNYFGSRFFALIFVLPLAFPAYVLAYSYVGFFEFRGLLSQIFSNTELKLDIMNIYGAIFIFTIAMYPYIYVLGRVSFASVSKTVVELVQINKLTSTKAFFQVYLPLSYPAIFAGLILALMETISDYGTVFYLGVETFSLGVFKSWFGYGDISGAIYVSIVLLVFVFSILLIEYQIRKKFRFASSTHSFEKASKIDLIGKQNFFAFLISFLISSITFFIPLLVLIYWTYLDFGEWEWESLELLANTLKLNFISSLFIIFLSFIVVYMLRFYPTKPSVFIHKMSILGYSIPGAVVALGLLVLANFIDNSLQMALLNGSFIVLIFAYTTRYFATSIGSVENGFSKIDSNLDDASKIFGKSESSNLFKIYFPLLKPYLLSGFLILYIDIAKELPATLLLRPFNYDTLAIRIYELSTNEMLYKVGFPSLILVSTTAVAVILLNSKIIRRRK